MKIEVKPDGTVVIESEQEGVKQQILHVHEVEGDPAKKNTVLLRAGKAEDDEGSGTYLDMKAGDLYQAFRDGYRILIHHLDDTCVSSIYVADRDSYLLDGTRGYFFSSTCEYSAFGGAESYPKRTSG